MGIASHVVDDGFNAFKLSDNILIACSLMLRRRREAKLKQNQFN